MGIGKSIRPLLLAGGRCVWKCRCRRLCGSLLENVATPSCKGTHHTLKGLGNAWRQAEHSARMQSRTRVLGPMQIDKLQRQQGMLVQILQQGLTLPDARNSAPDSAQAALRHVNSF